MPKQPIVEEGIVSNVWIHTMFFEKKGDFKNGHKHNFDHAHLVCAGSVEVYVMNYIDGMIEADRTLLGVFKQGDRFLVPKETSHTVIALEDGSLGACIQAVRDNETGDIISAFDNSKEWDSDFKVQL